MPTCRPSQRLPVLGYDNVPTSLPCASWTRGVIWYIYAVSATINTPFATSEHQLQGVSLMSSPNPNPLERLLRLNRSPSNPHDQISNILYGEEYKQWVQDINDSDAVRLVDYLDKVRCSTSFFDSHSNHPRLLTFSTLQVPVSGSVYEN